MQGNILGQGGGSLTGLNVYTQIAEPSKKDGIWIKTEETEVDENITLPEILKNKYNKVETIDNVKMLQKGIYNIQEDSPQSTYGCSIVNIGADIYLFGGVDNKKSAYKYNILTKKYTPLADIPVDFYLNTAVVVGTDIYLISGKAIYKYNTTLNTYTSVLNAPISFNTHNCAVSIGTDIYLFGGNDTKTYRYSTVENIYTPLADIPVEFSNGSITTDGENIYFFIKTYAYKYNILTNTYIQLTNVPYFCYGSSAITFKEDIYIFGCAETNSNENTIYSLKYSKSGNNYTELLDLPIEVNHNETTLIGEEIYIFLQNGSTNITNKVYKYKIQNPINNTVYIENGERLLKTKLSKMLEIYFSNAYIYNNGILSYPVYYGNGQEWIKI